MIPLSFLSMSYVYIGEDVLDTLKREFAEEALDGVDNKTFEELWKNGVEIYRGYVDDPRNTGSF